MSHVAVSILYVHRWMHIRYLRSVDLRSLWANNGDAISRQYAGTNALKGDYTRTGERNISGLMKDGVNSASR